MAKKYSKKTQEHVEKTMRKRKRGELKSGSGKKVKDRDQAIAIALSEAREKGYKAPPEKGGSRKKNSSAKKTAGTRSRKAGSKK